MATTAEARPGRPRDSSIDERAIAATRDLLVEVGFEGTTVQAVAKRAAIHASAIYRRWPSRVELIEDAISPSLELAVEPTGDLRTDLRRFLRAYLAAFDNPAARAASPWLLAHRASGHEGRSSEEHLVSTRPLFRDIVRAAPPGSVDPDLDLDDVFDVFLGAVLARTIVPTIVGRRPIERTVEVLVRLLRPTVAIDEEDDDRDN